MNNNYSFNKLQLLCLASLMLLSPALRLFPNGAAEYASQAAIFTAFAAFPFLLLYIRFISLAAESCREGEGMAELFLRSLGNKAGRAALITVSLWFLIYGAFILRVGADRLITSIYPHSSPALFIIVMGLICTLAAAGSARTIVRAAKLILPLIFIAVAFILFFALFSVSKENLLPVSINDIPGVLLSSISVVNIFSVILCLICFLLPFLKRSGSCFRALGLWLIPMLGFITLLCIAVIGSFGAELSLRLSWPFFVLVRNLVFFNSLERIEALVVSLWVFPDFLLVSAILYACQYSLRLALGENSPGYKGEKIFSTNNKRLIIPLCGLICISSSLLIAKEPVNLEFWSKKLIPITNLAVSLLFIPGIYAYGKIKKKL